MQVAAGEKQSWTDLTAHIDAALHSEQCGKKKGSMSQKMKAVEITK